MARVALGFFPKWIARDDLPPLFTTANQEVRAKAQSLLGLHLQHSLQIDARSRIASKDQVAALKDGACAYKAKFREQLSQIRHRDGIMPTDIDASKKSYLDRHRTVD
jgi:hypothetical protein